MLDPGSTISHDAARGGRVSRKESMTRPRYQEGCLWTRGKRRKMWVIRWRENVLQPDGSVKRILRAETLGPVGTVTRQRARNILQERLKSATQGQSRPQGLITLADFVSLEWRPNAALALKRSTVQYYDHQLKRHILPAFGSCSISELNRGGIETVLSSLRQKGHANGTIRGVRATFSTVLQTAVERGYAERNIAHATLLTEVGESIKTTQSLLGHSDLGTTLNTYSHVIPASQRRAVERVSEVMFSSVLKLDEKVEQEKIN
jgi:hypothetical protein